MSVMKKTMLAAVILASAGMNVAQAGVNGSGITATTDIVFSSSSNISNTLTPSSNLASGKHSGDYVVARGMVHSLDGIPHVYAIKFSPEISPSTPSSGLPTAIVRGKNDSNNQLFVTLSNSSKESSTYPKDGYLIISAYGSNDKPIKTSTYSVVASGSQDIAADTYTISTVAYTYTS